ncbi:MAG TPA: AlkA N-terminal domain-containing protein [Solirubrobacteraceae bacterium]|nr:AlkA N-terminal domain-containing protein [Solirubrobacteraceae bacterium]
MTALIEFLALRAVPGVEAAGDGSFRRTVRLAHGPAVVALGAAEERVDRRDRAGAARALERLAGADPAAADAHLAGDPVLGPLIAARPGLRMPGTVDGGELAVRAVLGQQVSLAAARTLAGRLVQLAGEPLDEPAGSLTHLWPRPEAIAEAAPRMPMPRSRQRTLAALATALTDGLVLEREALLELPGIGPWTADYVAMRLGDPDAWLPTDLGVRRGLERLGVGEEAAEAWRPFRAHAVRHLWAVAGLSANVNPGH